MDLPVIRNQADPSVFDPGQKTQRGPTYIVQFKMNDPLYTSAIKHGWLRTSHRHPHATKI